MNKLTSIAAIAFALFGSASFAQCWGGACYSGSCYSGQCYQTTRSFGVSRPILANGAGTACRNGSCFQRYRPSAIVAQQASDAFDSEILACNPCECDPCQCENCPGKQESACETCEPVETTETTEPTPACGQVATQATATVCANGACVRRPVASAVKTTVAASYLAAANAIRALRGLPALQYDPSLDAGSFNHAVSMSHYGALYHASGVSEICAQNNGAGIDTALQQWTQSPGHAAILFNPRYTRAGFASYRDASGRNWCVARFL